MRTLVINPPNSPFTEKSLLIEPIDALGIASYMQMLGHDVAMLDMDVKKIPPEGISRLIDTFRPQLTIVPFDYHIPLHRSEAIPGVNAICNIAQSAGSKVIVPGKTARYYPETFLRNNADVVIRGEVEQALPEIIQTGFSPQLLAKVNGIAYLQDGVLRTTDERDMRAEHYDLNRLPIPDRELIDLKDYIEVRTMLSSRGCFFQCGFCATPDFWGRGVWRYRSADRIVDEIELLTSKYSAKKILFLDDNATTSRERMRDISQGIIDRGIDVKLGCLSTVLSYEPATFELMAKAGFRWIHYGAESGAQDVLAGEGKAISAEMIREAVKGTREHGMRVRTSWILDLPEMKGKSLQQTIDLIIETEPDEVRIHYLALRAGSRIYQDWAKLTGKAGELPSQYIHNANPVIKHDWLFNLMLEDDQEALTTEFEKRGYLIVKDTSVWRDVEAMKAASPGLKFISFCPSRYGVGW